ncbi:MAG TPA: hypothetical protein VHG69_03805 [Thermoleophilaceae bacterium]|nr:hypothetical protein [Thermoleophilaceae bacterium]
MEPTTRKNLITDEEIAAAADGSPKEALLEWFQAVQFADAAAAEDLTAPESVRRASPDRVARSVRAVRGSLGRPRFDEVRIDGPVAHLRTRIFGYLPGQAKPAGMDPTTFEMRRIDGDWKVVTLDYLLRGAGELAQGAR